MATPSTTPSKVPPVALAFWVVKVLATTLGETGGDALSMTLELGYGLSTLVFLAFFAVTLAVQVRSSRYHPVWYWAVVVATTTVGTTTSDFFDRTLGLDSITTRKNEVFYWVTILVSNTLGTALGDFAATDAGLGFERGALVFAGLIALVALLRLVTRMPGSVLFWAAYVLTRPLGATLGDLLTKPAAEGGLDLGRLGASAALAAAMVLAISVTSLRRRPVPG